MTENAKMFGEEAGNEISIWYKSNGEVDGVRFRIDLRNLDFEVISQLVVLAKRLDCLFLSEYNGMVNLPNFPELMKSIRGSNAWKFASNPEGYIDGRDT